MKKFMTLALGVILAILCDFAMALGAPATVYSLNPTYIPTSVSAGGTVTPASLSAAGGSIDIGPFTLQANTTTVNFGVTGTYSALTATAYITSDAPGTVSPNWQMVPVDSLDGDRYFSITGNGLYRINAAGSYQVKITVTAITGTSVTIDYSAGMGEATTGTWNINKHSYSATVTALAPAASATDFFTITGSATKTVAVTHLECSGQATGSGSKLIQLATRSTANSAGTSAAVTATPHDLTDPAATATVLSYTANPTTGTLVGYTRSGILNLPAAAAVGTPPVAWDFGSQSRSYSKEIILRGITQVLAVHGAGASFPAGSAVNCQVEWTEY